MNKQIIISLSITLLALTTAIVHIIWPNLEIDGVTLGLLMIAIIPWLGPVFRKIKLPGGWEFEYQEMKKKVEEAQGAAQSASNKADLAISGYTSQPISISNQSPSSADELIIKLAQEYNHIRTTQKPGIHRTSEMTAIVSKMIALVSKVTNIDFRASLKDSDRGKRLIGYAYLYAIPNFNYISDLITSVTQVEDKPFGQYWGLLAISKTLEGRNRKDISTELIQSLQKYQNKLRQGTDRYYEVSKILRELG